MGSWRFRALWRRVTASIDIRAATHHEGLDFRGTDAAGFWKSDCFCFGFFFFVAILQTQGRSRKQNRKRRWMIETKRLARRAPIQKIQQIPSRDQFWQECYGKAKEQPQLRDREQNSKPEVNTVSARVIELFFMSLSRCTRGPQIDH